MALLLSGTRIYGTANVDSTLLVGTVSSNVSTSNTTGSLVVTGGVGISGNVYSSNVFVLNDVVAGLQDGSPLGGATNPIISSIGNANNFIQTYSINYSNTSQASTDFVAYPNNGTDSSGWIDMGITSNAFSQAVYSTTGRNEGYLFMSAPAGSGTSGNLVLSTDSTGTFNSIEFYTGGFNAIKGTANVVITTQTTSVSNTTGTLIVNGGLGVRGNVYTGNVVITGSGNGITFTDGTRMTTAATGGGGSSSGYLANSVIIANSTGYLSNTSALSFFASNNTLQITGNVIVTGTIGGISPRTFNVATSSTPTPNASNTDQYILSAFGQVGGGIIQIPTGTANDGQRLMIRIKDKGAANALGWITTAGGYRAIGVTLPTTTVAGKVLYVGCIYNSQDAYWDVVSVAQQ